MSRIVLITGCSSGIGHALARGFARNGDTVIATARKPETLSDLAAMGCDVQPLDVNDGASIDALTAHIEARHGKLDVLLNNAGVAAMGPVIEVPASVMRDTLETNTIAPVIMAQKCLRLLRLADQPVILQIGSVSGVLTTPFAGPYCASKAAVHMMTKALHKEEAGHGIRAIGLSPGTVATEMQREIKASGVNPVSQLDWSDHIPAEWPAKCLLWLCGPDGDAWLGQEVSLRDEDVRRSVGLIE